MCSFHLADCSQGRGSMLLREAGRWKNWAREMAWHKVVFTVCHWKRIDEGVALSYPTVASPAHPGWPSQGMHILLFCTWGGMGTDPFKVLTFILFFLLFTQEWLFLSSAKLIHNKGKPRLLLWGTFTKTSPLHSPGVNSDEHTSWLTSGVWSLLGVEGFFLFCFGFMLAFFFFFNPRTVQMC